MGLTLATVIAIYIGYVVIVILVAGCLIVHFKLLDEEDD